MSDAQTPDFDPENPVAPASFALTEGGWEEIDYIEPGADWRITEDGSYESPDGLTRTRPISEPAEWSDATDVK